MADDLRESLLEEIALEGLDGITTNALFLRLEERRGFPLRVNDQSKQFIWNCVLDLQDIEFYQLDKPRPELVSFNRFHYVDPDTRHFLETDSIPDDIYTVKILEEEGVYGSCSDFRTRKNITQQVRDVKQPLKVTVEKYGSTLVIVADQHVRVRTIIGPDNDPILNLSNPSYCILERIARSRYSGETSSGKRSLQLLGQSSKTLFYQIKKFQHLGIIKRQRVCAVKPQSNAKISHFLYHLKRFYSRVLSKQQMELRAIIEFLSKQPENMCEVTKLKTSVKLHDKNFKKISQLCIGPDRIFEFIDVPYREVHPNSSPMDFMTKHGKSERSIRHIKALKTIEDLRKSWDQAESSEDEEEDEEEEREEPVENELATSFQRAYDLPYMFQVMEVFRSVGARGLSQMDLLKIMKSSRLSVRRVVNFLIRSNYLRTVTLDRGRQKILMFVAIENVQDNKICQNMMKEIVKYGPTSTGELDKLGTGHGKTKKKYEKKGRKGKSDKQEPTRSPNPTSAEIKITEPSTSGLKVTTIAEEKIDAEPPSLEGEIITGRPPLQGEIITEPSQLGREIITPPSGRKVISDVPTSVEEITTDSPESEDKISSIHKELDKVDESFSPTVAGLSHGVKMKKEVLRQIISEDESLVKVTVEELYQPKPGSSVLGLKRFGSMLSESHIRRINWIVEVVSAIKVIESFRMLKLLRNREKEMQISTSMDNKSLKRLVVALTEDKKIRCFQAQIKMGERNKDLTYLCSPEVDEKSATLVRHLEEAKLRYFSISKEELRKYQQRPKKEMTSHNTLPGVPETAQESIREYREYRKKLSIGHIKMKFNRKAGLRYGLLPKMLRIQAAHQYLFHLCYDTYGNDIVAAGGKASDADKQLTLEEDVTTMNAADKVIQPVIKVEDEGWPSQDPPIYFDEWTWRRHLSPVPLHSGYPKGWCLLSDVLLRLPVYLFCQIVNVCYDIDGLHDILQNTKRKFYPMINLPLNISQQLLHSKKYVYSFLELCNYLCEMGLLTFGKEAMREQTFVYIHQNASMLDTRESLKGYNKTTAPENVVFPTKSFRFEKLSDLHGFWESLQIIALTSNMNYKSRCQNDLSDERTFVVRSLKDVTEPCAVEDIIDDGVLPGDRRGAAGMDSSLFVHCLKNWTFRSMTKSAVGDKPYPRNYLSRGLQTGLEIIGKRKTVDNYNEGLKLKGQDRLYLSENPDKPIEIKKVKRENVKINRGGKGIKKNLPPSKRVFNRPDRRPKVSKLNCFVPKLTRRKRAFEKGDDKDRAIYSTRTKQRVVWTEKEDSMLLMCRLATLIMDVSRKVSVVSYMTMRDFLHENCGEMSKDKSSQACNRRLKFVLKNKNTESNLLLYYREAIQDEYIVKNYMSRQYINTDANVIPCFKSLTNYLIQKFQELNVQKCTLPASLKELYECNIEPIERLSNTSHKQYKDVTCKEDICKDVLRNILHSAVLLQDKQSRTHEMFKLLTQYPDLILSDVIKELRADGLFVIQKKITLKIPSTSRSHSRCFVCKRPGPKLVCLSADGRLSTFLAHNVVIPAGSRCCPRHIHEGGLIHSAVTSIQTKTDTTKLNRTAINDLLQKMRSLCLQMNKSLNFDSLNDSDYPSLTRLTKSQFDDVCRHLTDKVKNSPSRSSRTSIGIFLVKLCSGMSNRLLSTIFGITKSSVRRAVSTVRQAFMRGFVPLYLGIDSLTRESVIRDHTRDLAKTLFGTADDQVILVLDGTYIYINKSNNFKFQRRTYCTHKGRPLVKPMVVVTTTGYFVTIVGPYLSDSKNNDASILNHMLMSNIEDIRCFLKDGDVFVVDRGFRDSVKLLEELGIQAEMPSILSKGHRQMSTEEANSSRLVTKNYQREAISQLHAGLGLRNFKVSQRYMYNYKHRYLSTLFEESAEFLDKLCQLHHGEGHKGMTLDFHPKGGQSAILIPLVLQKMINLKITMPTDLVVIDMEGFYNFPWGRGKLGTQRADKTLQELQNKIHPTPGPSGMSKKLTTGTKNPSFVDEGSQESVAVVKENSKSVKDSSAVIETGGPGEAKSCQVDGKVAQSMYDITDREKMDTEEEDRCDSLSGSQLEVTNDNHVRKTAESDKHTGEKMDCKLAQSNADNRDSEMMQTEDTSGLSKSRIDDDTDKHGISSSKEKSDQIDKPVEYSILKNGSSTILMPKNEQRLPCEESLLDLNFPHGIASRTLISLRRSEGPLSCSVEDIRMFNAQDNFVVKSCEIEINIRESGLGSGKARNEESKDGANSEEIPEDRAKLIDSLMPPKLKMKQLWDELQRLLPFKLDVSEMWKSMAVNHRISEENLEFYKHVYQFINSHGELGIKMFHLKRHFSDSFQWKNAIKMLAHYAAD